MFIEETLFQRKMFYHFSTYTGQVIVANTRVYIKTTDNCPIF